MEIKASYLRNETGDEIMMTDYEQKENAVNLDLDAEPKNLKLVIPAYMREDFNYKFEKSQKKLAKLGFELRILSEESEYRTSDVLKDNRGRPMSIIFQTIEVNVPQIRKVFKQDRGDGVEEEYAFTTQKEKYAEEDMEFVGIVTHNYAVPQTFTKDDSVILLDYIPSDWKLTCQHCNAKRYRTKYFFFRKKGENEFKILGTACVRQYFGLNIEKLLRTYEKEVQLWPEEYERRGKVIPEYRMSDVLQSAIWYSATNTYFDKYLIYQWVNYQDRISSASKDQAKEMIAKYKKYKEWLEENKDLITEKIIQLYNEAEELQYNRGINDPSITNFDVNYLQFMFDNNGLRRVMLNTLNGTIGYRVFNLFKQEKEAIKQAKREAEEAKNRITSKWIGNIGERLHFGYAQVEFQVHREGNYGMFHLYKFRTEEGFLLTWFASEDKSLFDGVSYELKGTVKSHNEYKGTKETQITRGKIGISKKCSNCGKRITPDHKCGEEDQKLMCDECGKEKEKNGRCEFCGTFDGY